MEVGTGLVSRVEALARWPRAGGEQVPPDVFIPLAEETGLIGALTRGVPRSVPRQCWAWRRAGQRLKVGVNLSMANLAEPELAETILALLKEYKVSPESLRVELTESAVMSEQAHSLEVLSRLVAAGIAVSVDDFGTGYSSLAYLTRLPVDELKIDKSFVQRVGENRADEVIVRSTVAMAHALGLRVVAEGVEDAAAWALLEQYGCDAAQGYYLSRPLPAAELERWLRAPRRHLMRS